jgi:hypothetical protein
MKPIKILEDTQGNAICPCKISERIIAFGDSYCDAIKEIFNKMILETFFIVWFLISKSGKESQEGNLMIWIIQRD